MGELAKAEEKFNESLKYSRELGIPQGLYYSYTGLGNVAEQRGNWTGALEYYQRSLEVAENLGAAPFRQQVTQKLYQIYKEQNDFERALNYYEAYKFISDSLRRISNEQALAETESNLNLIREEEINRLLREKQQQQEARIAAQNWLIAAGVAIIVVILISLFLLYRSNAENKRINKELAAQRNQLEELNKVKDKILAIIAHDLRSPLASMQSMLYLIREDDLSREEIKSMTAELEVSLNQNLSMMDNLLAWAQEQMSGLALDIETINAHQVAEEVLSNYEFQADHKGITLNNEVSPDLKVKADFNLLKLILRNLVSNSIKFSREGDHITVRTREESGKIVFEVADTGIGIPEDKQEKLFSVESGSRSGTQNEQGSGLGLRLCKEFVEKQHGEIHLESQEGKGTTFFITFPEAS
jgi:signal transduction histidine kinase